MGLARLALAAVAHVWLTWGPPVVHAPAQEPTVAAPTTAPPSRADAAAPTAAPPTPAPQLPAPALDSRSVWPKAPAAQVQAGAPAPASGKPRGYLYRSRLFWAIAGGLVAGTVAITYAVTRPPPTPYYGSVGTIPFP